MRWQLRQLVCGFRVCLLRRARQPHIDAVFNDPILTTIGSGTDLALEPTASSSLLALCTLGSTGPNPMSPDMRLLFKYFNPYPSSTAAVKLLLSGLPCMRAFLLKRPPVAGEL